MPRVALSFLKSRKSNVNIQFCSSFATSKELCSMVYINNYIIVCFMIGSGTSNNVDLIKLLFGVCAIMPTIGGYQGPGLLYL